MNHTQPLQTLRLALLLGSVAFSAHAGDGHDHGDTPAAASGPALPRFSATSETFELVGVLDGKRLTLYLDRADDNSPVKDAKLALELAGTQVQAAPRGDGAFEATLAEAPKAGVMAVTATVLAGKETDLLAGEIDIHADAHPDAAAHGFAWQQVAAWTAAAAIALGGIVFAMRRARMHRIGGAA